MFLANFPLLNLDDIVEPTNPCVPSPCGLYSNCRVQNGHAVCSCVPNYIGAPPNCRPECMSSSDCSQDKSCINEKCKDPCPGTCGINAQCRVVNHNPICSCMSGFTGDPFIRCIYEESKNILRNFITSFHQFIIIPVHRVSHSFYKYMIITCFIRHSLSLFLYLYLCFRLSIPILHAFYFMLQLLPNVNV